MTNKIWKISVTAPQKTVENALLAHEEHPDWNYDIIIAGSSIDEDTPDLWQFEAWVPHKPSPKEKNLILGLFAPDKPDLLIESLGEVDWVTQSQQQLKPVRAGLFYIHTPDSSPCPDEGIHSFVIPASQAFGTGHHETTAGCLGMLTYMQKTGAITRNFVDVGTGTGLLAFAAMALWPRAFGTASDIDDVCIDVLLRNASLNAIPLGAGAGELTFTVADGMDSPLLQGRAPYDLVIANILAGPLIELAPDISQATLPGGNLLLAGLLATQEQSVRRAYFREGFRLARKIVNGDWSILWLRKRGRVRI